LVAHAAGVEREWIGLSRFGPQRGRVGRDEARLAISCEETPIGEEALIA